MRMMQRSIRTKQPRKNHPNKADQLTRGRGLCLFLCLSMLSTMLLGGCGSPVWPGGDGSSTATSSAVPTNGGVDPFDNAAAENNTTVSEPVSPADVSAEDTTSTQPEPGSGTAQPASEPTDAANGGTPLMQTIPETAANMTLEEKIGQMLAPAFRTNAAGLPLHAADAATLEAVRTCKPGGVVLFAQNMDTPAQTAALIRQFQGVSGIPLLVGVDEEGGKVSRLSAAKNMQAVTMPAARTIGSTGDPKFAREAAAAIGSQLSYLGFNLDFAPDADVDTNPQNPVIGSRSYGRDPNTVADMVTSALAGFADTSVIPVVKHFPGHGDTQTDSHLGLAVVPHDRERMDRIELVPFKAAIAAGVPVIMTAHVNTPGISSRDLPATLNPDILTGLLREELGFKGVITTDAMEMGAITEHYGEAESIVMAVEAGADMLLVPVSLANAAKALREAVESGRIPETRIDASVERILALKRTWRLDARTAGAGDALPDKIPGTDAYRELVSRIEAAAAAQQAK